MYEFDIFDTFQAHVYHVNRLLAFPNYFKIHTLVLHLTLFGAPRAGSFRWEDQKLKVVRTYVCTISIGRHVKQHVFCPRDF